MNSTSNNNTSTSSNANIASKYNLPKFSTASSTNTTTNNNNTNNINGRIISTSHMADSTFLHPNDSLVYNTTRTVSSSSTSMISTPSNNIRRFQKHRQQQATTGQQQTQRSHHDSKSQHLSKNAGIIKTKLLNLHQSSKRYVDNMNYSSQTIDESHPNRSIPSFIIHKPMNMNGYDYSVFTNYPNGIDLQHGDHLPPAIKESQIKAWESAERMTKNIIFGDSSESEDDGLSENEGQDNNNNSINNNIYKNGSIGKRIPTRSKNIKNNIIQAIPGYTRGELQIILESFNKSGVKDDNSEAELKRLLNESKRDIQDRHDKIFQQAHTYNAKRQVQITQKKEVLTRLFGLSNGLNQDYITNNSIYSAFDNSSNIQKTFVEDRDEISGLLEEDRAFQLELEDTRTLLMERSNDLNGEGSSSVRRKRRRSFNKFDMDEIAYDKFQTIIKQKLDKIYKNQLRKYEGIDVKDVSSQDQDHNQDQDHDHDDSTTSQDDNQYSFDDYDGAITDQFNEELHFFTLNFLRKCVKLATTDNNGGMSTED
ncbi:anaphase-promoting complex subunit 9-domain-containing protein [Scheffersomyces amazonensis]|uniref:anaphase-promoting complex subunit 9-domain-containing protein n=1 Tax=Scheffersomyces amazonensis TaxID=1078765 RepID=UPI00315C7D62